MNPSVPLFRPDGAVVIQWRCSWRERLRILLGGTLYTVESEPSNPRVILSTTPPRMRERLPRTVRDARDHFETLKDSRSKS